MRGFERRPLARENLHHAAAAGRGGAARLATHQRRAAGLRRRRRRLRERPGHRPGRGPRHPHRRHGGRQPPGCHEQAAAPVRAPPLPELPHRRPGAAEVRRHRTAAGSPPAGGDRRGRPRGVRSARRPADGAGLRRQPGRAEPQPCLSGRVRAARPGPPGGPRLRAAQPRRRGRRAGSRGAPLERYHLVAYTDRLADAMAAADLVVGRSGGSVAEIAALGRPAILVPYPYASADHQRKNAEWMARAGAALVVARRRHDRRAAGEAGRRAARRPYASGRDGRRQQGTGTTRRDVTGRRRDRDAARRGARQEDRT